MNALDRARLEAVSRRLDRIEGLLGELVRVETKSARLVNAFVEAELADREPSPGGRHLRLVRDE